MPRGPRLDAPGVLHHVVARGIERRPIFRGRPDYEDFVRRLAGLAAAGHWAVYAWALLPNHVHLLVRTGARPLGRSMRSLLTGYAGAFNRRHRRAGHLFQNRYRSIVVEEEPYFLELIRYLHLNPLRAGIVPDLRALARYPYAGHAALLGTVPRPWQATGEVLGRFASKPGAARGRYRAFVAEGVPLGRRPEFRGGGLVRSAGGWQAVVALRRGREAYRADERVLGTGAFVEALLREVARHTKARDRAPLRGVDLGTLAQRIGASLDLAPAMILGRTRARQAARARQVLAFVWVEHLGRPASELARGLGQTRGNVSLAAKRGEEIARPWQGAIPGWCGQ
jgi:REP element-mobilizing transposase RayT